MGRNFVVLRRSPDWATFDLESTRAFCRALQLREDLIIDFAGRWDAVSGIGFLSYREAMKTLALRSAHAVVDATVLSHEALAGYPFEDDDLLYFTDDDDWVDPHLFNDLRSQPGPVEDGWLWRSVFVGKLFSDTPQEKGGGDVVQRRPTSDVVYTNNYAVSGVAWRRLGPARLLEHYDAQAALDHGAWAPLRRDAFLSGANKHPCCTVCIEYNMRSERFATDMPAAIRLFVHELEAAAVDAAEPWLGKAVSGLIEINRRAIA